MVLAKDDIKRPSVHSLYVHSLYDAYSNVLSSWYGLSVCQFIASLRARQNNAPTDMTPSPNISPLLAITSVTSSGEE